MTRRAALCLALLLCAASALTVAVEDEQRAMLAVTLAERGAQPHRVARRAQCLVADDDPRVAEMLREYLERLGLIVRATSSAQVARQWLRETGEPVILDGSVLGDMGISLRELPTTRVIIWSGDPRLVREARQLGLRAFCKGDLQDFQGLLQGVADRNFVSVPAE